MLLAEDLVLLALHPEQGGEVNSCAEHLVPSVTGALVLELALLEAITLDEASHVVATGLAPKDPLLVEVLAALALGTSAKKQLRQVERGLGRARDRVVDRLADAQVIGRRTSRIIRITTHPLLQPDVRDEVLARLRDAAAGHGEIEPRTAVVLALAGPCRLLEVVAGDTPHKHVKERIQLAAEPMPVAPTVRRLVIELLAVTKQVVIDATSSSS